MLKIHSIWAAIVVVVVALATINALIGKAKNKPFESRDFSLALLSLIGTHTQFIFGIILLAMNNQFGEMSMGEIMKVPALRLTHVEHPSIMLIAIVLITIGYSKHKKALTSDKKFKTLAIFYTIAFLLMLSRIPWSNWLNSFGS